MHKSNGRFDAILSAVSGKQRSHFPIGILGQVWYLIVSIPDLCHLTYFYTPGPFFLIYFAVVFDVLKSFVFKCTVSLK